MLILSCPHRCGATYDEINVLHAHGISAHASSAKRFIQQLVEIIQKALAQFFRKLGERGRIFLGNIDNWDLFKYTKSLVAGLERLELLTEEQQAEILRTLPHFLTKIFGCVCKDVVDCMNGLCWCVKHGQLCTEETCPGCACQKSGKGNPWARTIAKAKNNCGGVIL